MTKYQQMSTEKGKKSTDNFCCVFCNFTTSRKSHMDRHLTTLKHKNQHLSTKKYQKSTNQFECICGKKYTERSGLWRHKHKGQCNQICTDTNTNTNTNTNTINTDALQTAVKEKDELIKFLMKETQEFKGLVLEILKNGISNTNYTNINSHNKSFNLNLFLNETCKDAMNITDFVESLQIQITDLENVGEIGYIEGISNIIIKNLNALDITERPIHCTDKKRETMYIKDENKWEKEDENRNKMRKMVKKVANKNISLINTFQELHPEYKKITSKYADQYNKIIIESMGGKGDNDYEKEEKIIKKIAKEVFIDKETVK